MPNEPRNGNDGGGRILRFDREPSFYAKRGDAKRAKNDPISAVSMYYEALERDPMDLDTRLAAAEVLTDMSRFNDSDRLVIPYMHEDAEFMKEAYCIVGFNLLGMGETEGARGCFNRFFELTDEVSARTDAILDALDYIDSLDPEETLLSDASAAEYEAKLMAAHKAFDSGNFQTASDLFKSLHEKHPDDAHILYELSLSFLCDLKAEEGGKYADLLLEKQPKSWGGMALKLMSARALGNEIDMKRTAKLLEKCDSDNPDELFRVNGALLEADFAEQAMPTAKKLVKLLPFDQLANHRLAVCFMRTGQYKKAAELYDKLLRIDRNDSVAKFYRAGCVEADRDPDCAFARGRLMNQYQLPMDSILEGVKTLLGNKDLGPDELRGRWESDPDFRATVRWSFTLREFNITYAMLAVLRVIGDNKAERLLREVLADIDVSGAVMNEALGVLKSMGAKEPFFAMADGRLLEGRVNIVDFSDIRIPTAYSEIFPRMRSLAEGLYSSEVISIAAGIVERLFVGCAGNFPKISKEQSVAMSAAVEFLACERCGVLVRDDLFSRYGITERRLENAIDRIIQIIMSVGGSAPIDGNGDGE